MLEENARVALMIGESLRDQTIQMGLYEMENLLNRYAFMPVALMSVCLPLYSIYSINSLGQAFTFPFHPFTSIPSHPRFREALVEFGKEHRRDPSNKKNKFYLHYLLASISNCIILK